MKSYPYYWSFNLFRVCSTIKLHINNYKTFFSFWYVTHLFFRPVQSKCHIGSWRNVNIRKQIIYSNCLFLQITIYCRCNNSTILEIVYSLLKCYSTSLFIIVRNYIPFFKPLTFWFSEHPVGIFCISFNRLNTKAKTNSHTFLDWSSQNCFVMILSVISIAKYLVNVIYRMMMHIFKVSLDWNHKSKRLEECFFSIIIHVN